MRCGFLLAASLSVALTASAQAPCDTAATKLHTDNIRAAEAQLRTVLQPPYVPAGLPVSAAAIDSIVRSWKCWDPTPIPTPNPPPSNGFPVLGVAEVPRVQLSSARPTATRQVQVPNCGVLTAAWNSMRGGDELILAPGLVCNGPFTVPSRAAGDSAWIVIRGDVGLAASGVRMRPSVAAQLRLPILRTTTNNTPAIQMAAGSGWVRIENIELTADTLVTLLDAVVVAGTSGATRADTTLGPLHLVSTYIHGRSTLPLKRCVVLHARGSIVDDSWLDDCRKGGQDSQAIVAWNTNGPLRIVNNYLAGCGENVMFGGSDPTIVGAVPSDIEFRGNHVKTPGNWKGVNCTKKNVLELKSVRRIYMERNVFEGSWADGQTGFALNFKSANQSGGCRWCGTSDVTMVDNLVRHTVGWLSLSGPDGTGPVDSTTRRVTIVRTLVEDTVAIAPYNTTGQIRVLMLQGPAHDIEFQDFRVIDYARDPGQAILFASNPITRAAFTNGVLKRGQYGVSGNGEGTATLTKFAPGAIWQGMIITGANLTLYPPGTQNTATATDGLNPLVLKAKLAGVIVPP